MIMTFDSFHNKIIKRLLEHSVYLTIIFFLVPGFFYFEICIVLPAIVEEWSVPYFIHYFCSIFLLFNIIGNMIYGMFTDTSIKQINWPVENKEDWIMCSSCESLRPQRAWHCDTCDICILKRDHHCTFFACCIGYYNHRYFMLFTLDIFVSMVYAFYYNVQYLAHLISWNHGFIIVKFIFPLASFALDFGQETVCIFLVMINFVVGMFTGFLIIFHFKNILNGKITPENKNSSASLYNYGLKSNLIEVFGVRWYLTWISPFIHSPLPGNGVDWILEDKHK